VFKLAIITAVLFGVLKSSVILSIPEQIVKMFNSESVDFIRMASKGLRVYYLAMPFAAFNIVSVVFLQSIEKPYPALLLSSVRTIGLILLGLMIFPPFFNVTGVWMILPFAELVTTIIILSYFRKTRVFSRK